MGVSAGGFNAAQIVFRYPGLFDRGILISPLIYPFSIYSGREIIDKTISSAAPAPGGLKHWIAEKIFKRDSFKFVS